MGHLVVEAQRFDSRKTGSLLHAKAFTRTKADPKQFSLHHAWYKNAKPNLMANNGLKYRRILPELRAELQSSWNRPIVWPLYVLLGLVLLVILPAAIAFRRQQRQPALQEGR